MLAVDDEDEEPVCELELELQPEAEADPEAEAEATQLPRHEPILHSAAGGTCCKADSDCATVFTLLLVLPFQLRALIDAQWAT